MSNYFLHSVNFLLIKNSPPSSKHYFPVLLSLALMEIKNSGQPPHAALGPAGGARRQRDGTRDTPRCNRHPAPPPTPAGRGGQRATAAGRRCPTHPAGGWADRRAQAASPAAPALSPCTAPGDAAAATAAAAAATAAAAARRAALCPLPPRGRPALPRGGAEGEGRGSRPLAGRDASRKAPAACVITQLLGDARGGAPAGPRRGGAGRPPPLPRRKGAAARGADPSLGGPPRRPPLRRDGTGLGQAVLAGGRQPRRLPAARPAQGQHRASTEQLARGDGSLPGCNVENSHKHVLQ
ncbi:uncharacterized protein [Ciconia boyciana]|uniref:uncharacterized protein n=1 Tax=Ciconia boyciana TaxID=52775 RepID=UPI003BA0A009